MMANVDLSINVYRSSPKSSIRMVRDGRDDIVLDDFVVLSAEDWAKVESVVDKFTDVKRFTRDD